MNITQRNSPNRTIGRQGRTPDFIAIHTTGGSFTSAINTIMNAANQVSYHFVISRIGEIVQAVNIENTAWANGTRNDGGNMCNSRSTIRAVRDRRLNANVFTISIGFGDMPAGNPSEAQIIAAVNLIRHIRSEVRRIYGFDIPMARSNIVGHHEITPVIRPDCPGRAFPFDEIIRRINGQVAPPSAPAPSTFQPYTVRVTADVLNIRRGPGTNHAAVGAIRDRGVYTIVEEANGAGASRWGRLRSGAGWISLDFVRRQ